mmetsp:Transcript_30100/g.65683  ORF Transcript_30100/g.65683 Transcript_30100/m.65683 type:complete len:312 (+) Transcript_30100:53-988(+)
MSWYVDRNGRKVWIPREETVFTLAEPTEELPMLDLAYLAVETKQAVYQEHLIEEDAGGAKTKKSREKAAGRQRGYVVRVEQDDRSRVVPCFQAAVDRLMACDVVSRIDVDDGSAKKNRKKKKKKGDGSKEEDEELEPEMEPLVLASNQCHVASSARCKHFAHGPGFRLEVAEADARQRIMCFTAKKQLTAAEWHAQLASALLSTGSRLMEGRLEEPPPQDGDTASRGNEAQADEDEWLSSIMGRCMVARGNSEKQVGATANGASPKAADGDTQALPVEEAQPVAVPPWLRSFKRRPVGGAAERTGSTGQGP